MFSTMNWTKEQLEKAKPIVIQRLNSSRTKPTFEKYTAILGEINSRLAEMDGNV